MKEDNKIQRDINRTNPFKVPEGYFDNLTRRVMDNLPEQENKKTVAKHQPAIIKMAKWISAAAAVAVLLVCVKTFMPDTTEESTTDTANVTTAKNTDNDVKEPEYVSEEEYEMEVMRYAMIDREDIYSYLEGAE